MTDGNISQWRATASGSSVQSDTDTQPSKIQYCNKYGNIYFFIYKKHIWLIYWRVIVIIIFHMDLTNVMYRACTEAWERCYWLVCDESLFCCVTSFYSSRTSTERAAVCYWVVISILSSLLIFCCPADKALIWCVIDFNLPLNVPVSVLLLLFFLNLLANAKLKAIESCTVTVSEIMRLDFCLKLKWHLNVSMNSSFFVSIRSEYH